MDAEAAYAGLRVLDLGQGVAAPYCAMLLAMHGAEVIKLEPPTGDWSRGLGTQYGDHTAMSAHYNRGKRSLALDLKAPAAREIAVTLAARADVVIEGFRPGVAARLGLGYDELRARNPGLLYLSVSGFGHDGPYAALPCTDSVAQAFSGLMSVNLGNDGMPHRIGAIIIDTMTGLYAAQALAIALYKRERCGEGQRIEVSLAQCAAAMLGHKLAEHSLEGGAPRQLNAPTGAYRTRDGWIMVALVREEQYVRLVRALGRPGLADDPRFVDFAARAAHASVLVDILGRVIAGDTTEAWLARLRAADILADRVNGFDDWLADPHVVSTGGAVRVQQPGVGRFPAPRTPGIPPAVDAAMAPAPRIGEHGAAILAEIGFAAAAIARLRADNILFIPEAQ
ncbi:MAG: CoA transferase [Alphaproteobacteria bacterium]|nr:CoA transferase [Alphaproteobacteria bacterium]